MQWIEGVFVRLGGAYQLLQGGAEYARGRMRKHLRETGQNVRYARSDNNGETRGYMPLVGYLKQREPELR